MTDRQIQDRVRQYYEGRLRAHGATAAGVDWKSESSQMLRFDQLRHLWAADAETSIIDYGCGYGALAAYLRTSGHRGRYVGFDLSDQMAGAAVDRSRALDDCWWTSDRSQLRPADFAVASGIFNVKLDAGDEEWSAYMNRTIADMAALARRGFAFNALTSYSDAEKQRPDLYYANPLELFEHCRATYSRFVTLLHDYPLYEFTMIVRTAP
jgi:SAM-dependent methyltransferase